MNKAVIQELRELKFSYQAIGDRLGRSDTRIHQIQNPESLKAYQQDEKYKTYQKEYQKKYHKTDKFKAYDRVYHRHIYHLRVQKLFTNCERCMV